MSSVPDEVYSNLFETKDFLNIARSNSDSDEKINSARNAADNYVGNQIRLHASLPVPADANPELTSMASLLAASFFNQFQNPRKTEMREATAQQKQSVQDFILETFGLKNPSGLSGANTFGITKTITGFSTRTTTGT